MSIWDATRYGWAPVYWLTVEGIPVVWTERATGLTLPTGYTSEAAVLSLQEAGIGTEHIDRGRGIASTAPFGFALLDSTTTHAYLRRWDQETYITADLSATSPTVDVADTTGFAASGSVHIGRELVTYSGTTATSFTGCTRAVCGYAYAHQMGTSGQTVTDRPRYWLGREVTLWATPIDQGGTIPSTTLEAGAVQVWKGRITGLPQRRRDGFAFSCEQLDRLLDGELAGKISGKIVGIGSYFLVDLSDTLSVGIDLYDASNAVVAIYSPSIKVWAGSGKAQGDAVTGEQIRVRIAAAWAAWVTASGASTYIGEIKFVHKAGIWRGYVRIKKTASVEKAVAYIQSPTSSNGETKIYAGGMASDSWIALGWNFAVNPLDVDTSASGVVVELDDALAADITAPGILRVTVGGNIGQFAFEYVGTSGSNVYLGTSQKSAFPFTAQGVIGASCYILQTGAVTEIRDLILTTLESSGTGQRGPYDTLGRGLGYGIDETLINEPTFFDPSLAVLGNIEPDGRSFADMYGGTLALYRLAVVGRVDSGVWRFRLVGTEPGGTDTTADLTDADLMAHAGDPIEGADLALSPNAVTLRIGTDDNPVEQVYTALADVEATGRREAEWEIPANDPADVTATAPKWMLGLFAQDQTAQAVRVRVGPWVTAQPGDVIYLDGLTHPALWDWPNATQGYTGAARVVGRIFDPVTLRVTLTLLLSGGVKVSSLCPAANVLSWTGGAGAPATINVALKYLTVFQKCVPCDVIHLRPGTTESTGERYTISAVAEVAGETVLTVSAVTGVHTLDATNSYLTWPTTANSTTQQTRFAHVDDGGSWG